MAHGLRERGIAVRQMPLPAILALVHPQLHTSLDTALFGRLPRGLPIMVHDLRRGLAAFRREVVHKAILGGRAYRGRTARSAHAYILATFVEESAQVGENGDEHEHGDDDERPFAALHGGLHVIPRTVLAMAELHDGQAERHHCGAHDTAELLQSIEHRIAVGMQCRRNGSESGDAQHHGNDECCSVRESAVAIR